MNSSDTCDDNVLGVSTTRQGTTFHTLLPLIFLAIVTMMWSRSCASARALTQRAIAVSKLTANAHEHADGCSGFVIIIPAPIAFVGRNETMPSLWETSRVIAKSYSRVEGKLGILAQATPQESSKTPKTAKTPKGPPLPKFRNSWAPNPKNAPPKHIGGRQLPNA